MKNAITEISEPSNAAQASIEASAPYIVRVTICGSADLLLHAWNCEAVDEKAKAKKGSAEKKSDNLESYVRRDDDGFICLPSEYLRMAVIGAAKFRQDPRSPRKSAMDLYKACIVGMRPLSPILDKDSLPTKTWGYEHRCRVQVQRNGITRTRPAFKAGWSAEIELMCTLPEYVSQADLHDTVSAAGRLIGVGDFRPTYGRFMVTRFESQEA